MYNINGSNVQKEFISEQWLNNKTGKKKCGLILAEHL